MAFYECSHGQTFRIHCCPAFTLIYDLRSKIVLQDGCLLNNNLMCFKDTLWKLYHIVMPLAWIWIWVLFTFVVFQARNIPHPELEHTNGFLSKIIYCSASQNSLIPQPFFLHLMTTLFLWKTCRGIKEHGKRMKGTQVLSTRKSFFFFFYHVSITNAPTWEQKNHQQLSIWCTCAIISENGFLSE